MPPLAAGLTMSLLMIQGEEDCVTPAATNAELLAAALPHALLVMLPAAAICRKWSFRRASMT